MIPPVTEELFVHSHKLSTLLHLKESISSKKHKYHNESDLFNYSLKLKREKQTLLEIRSESRSTLGRKSHKGKLFPLFFIYRDKFNSKKCKQTDF